MQRFELKTSFGWTFFVLIAAFFWSAAVKFDASPSSASAVANRSTSDRVSATFDSTFSLESESAAPSDVLSEPTATLFETALSGASRRVQDSSRRRLGGDDFSSTSGSAKSPSFRASSFAETGRSSTVFRSFWACQSAARPLFLTLCSLRN